MTTMLEIMEMRELLPKLPALGYEIYALIESIMTNGKPTDDAVANAILQNVDEQVKGLTQELEAALAAIEGAVADRQIA